MRKFYNFKQRSWIYIVTILAIIILFICMLVNILKVCEVGNLVSYHHSQDILATVIMGVVIVVLSLAVFLCGISFKDKHIVYILGFVASKIRYEDVVTIRQDAAGKFLLIYYKTGGKGMVKDNKTGIFADVINVTCDNKYFDEIINKIREKNADVLIELVTVKPKDKKEEK
ncbi:MAG: hypothetical protein HDT32_05115 [Clostridiales bacterium]|nr:hypothetical protein [Clostridiales bacterium]